MLIKPLFKKFSSHRCYNAQKVLAQRFLQDIEADKGKTDKKLIRLSDEYAKEVLGWKGYAPWLYVYSAVNGAFKEGWIPDNYFARVVLPELDRGYGKLSDYKAISRNLFNSYIFPDLAYYVNGLFLSFDYKVVAESDIKNILFNNRNKVVYKLDSSVQGKGVYVIERETFEISRIKQLGNGVFQYYIQQHPFFSEMIPSSVATIRITTSCEDDGHVTVRASYLRLGRAVDKSIKWDTNIIIPIDLIDGSLNSLGYTSTLVPIDRHPDTKVIFANRQIPSFHKCFTTAQELHKQLPHCRIIGWDMVVDHQDQVKVMEWNGEHTDIKVHEALQGPCFADLGWQNLWNKAL